MTARALDSRTHRSLVAAELERRPTAGGDVRLLWLRENGTVLVEQRERLEGGTVRVTLRKTPPERCYDAFHHPELYPQLVDAGPYVVCSGEIEADDSAGAVRQRRRTRRS
jgi:hypothetical protein